MKSILIKNILTSPIAKTTFRNLMNEIILYGVGESIDLIHELRFKREFRILKAKLDLHGEELFSKYTQLNTLEHEDKEGALKEIFDLLESEKDSMAELKRIVDSYKRG